jgi:hypothetical protein
MTTNEKPLKHRLLCGWWSLGPCECGAEPLEVGPPKCMNTAANPCACLEYKDCMPVDLEYTRDR